MHIVEDDKLAITGASGFVGKHLQKAFKNVTVLHRDDSVERLTQKLKDVDTVINLAGAPIVKRWNSEYKKMLHSSRIYGTKKLVEAINKSEVSYFISTSAIGIYPNDKACDESCGDYADDFLASLCSDWEAEVLLCEKPTAVLRFGVVLGKEGGALKKMLLPFKLGLGGTIGDGKMMTSWIAMTDLLRIYHFLMDNKSEGVFNAVAPTPVTNVTFTKALGKAVKRPTWFPLPIFMLKLIYGESACVLTDSKEIYPKNIEDLGFVFEHSNIEDALIDIVS